MFSITLYTVDKEYYRALKLTEIPTPDEEKKYKFLFSHLFVVPQTF